MSTRLVRSLLLYGFALVLLRALPSGAQESAAGFKKHPPIGDLSGSKCETCHEAQAKTAGRHAADPKRCLACHEFFKQVGGGTTVRLVRSQPALCIGCHPALAPAAEGKLKAPHAAANDCANCHKIHVDTARLLTAPGDRAVCLTCHTQDDIAKSHPVPLAKSGCSSCHAPHGSNQKGMLAGSFIHAPFGDRSCDACHQKGRVARARRAKGQSSAASTCFACHSETEKKFSTGNVHTAVRNGDCAGCHNPHVANNKDFLKATGTALCTPCHAAVQKKAALAVRHAPVAKDCALCHAPHNAEAADQLKAAVPALCLKCHPATGPQAPQGKGQTAAAAASAAAAGRLAARHLGADMTKLDCGTCHEPHGSVRKGLLLSGSVHAPFEGGSCDSCHVDGRAKKLAENGSQALCAACHSDTLEAAKKAAVPHAAMEGECTACHSPHASTEPKLVKSPSGGACVACHEAQGAASGEFLHGAISRWGCQACHEPHGGAGARMLRVSGDDLCLGCHDPKKLRPLEGKDVVSLLGKFDLPAAEAARIKAILISADGEHGHPIAGHRFRGKATREEIARSKSTPTFDGELHCLTCHDPHKSKSRQLLSKGATGAVESCIRCHPK